MAILWMQKAREGKWTIDIMAYMPYNIYKGDYMTEFKLIAYEKENGEVPVEEKIS